jgi:hypothetical protein
MEVLNCEKQSQYIEGIGGVWGFRGFIYILGYTRGYLENIGFLLLEICIRKGV